MGYRKEEGRMKGGRKKGKRREQKGTEGKGSSLVSSLTIRKGFIRNTELVPTDFTSFLLDIDLVMESVHTETHRKI